MSDFIQVNIQVENRSPYKCQKEQFRAKLKLDDRIQSLARFLSGYIESLDNPVYLTLSFEGKVLQMERRVKDYAEVLDLELRNLNSSASEQPICLGTFDWHLLILDTNTVNESCTEEGSPGLDQSNTQAPDQSPVKMPTPRAADPSQTPAKDASHQTSNPTFKKYIELATSQFITGMHLNALKNFEKALALDLSNPSMATIIASVNMMVGFLHSQAGAAEKSQDYYQKGLELFFGSLGVKSPLTAAVTCNIGSVLLELGDNLQALDFYKSASDIVNGLVTRQNGERSNQNTATKETENPEITTESQTLTAEQRVSLEWPISYNLALVQHALRNFGLSLEVCKRALELALSVWGENDSRVGDVFQLISDNLQQMGLQEDSGEFLEKAIRIYQDNLDNENHLKLLNCKEKRSVLLAAQLKSEEGYQDALDELEEILSSKIRLLGESSALVADTYFNMGKLCQDQGQQRASLAYWHKSFTILSKRLEDYFSQSSAAGLGCSNIRGSSLDRSMILNQKIGNNLNSHQELLVSARGQKILTRILKILHLLITSEYNQGKFEQVEEFISYFNQKLDLTALAKPQSFVVKAGGQEVLHLLKTIRMTINGLAPILLLHFGKFNQAYSVATQGVEDCKREYGETHPKTYSAFFRLGWVCHQLGGDKTSEASLYLSLVEQASQEDTLKSDPLFKTYQSKLAELLTSGTSSN